MKKIKRWRKYPYPTWPGLGGLNRFGVKTSNLDPIDPVEDQITRVVIFGYIALLFIGGVVGFFTWV